MSARTTRQSPRRKVGGGLGIQGKRTGVGTTTTDNMDEMYESAFSPVARKAGTDIDDHDNSAVANISQSAARKRSAKKPSHKKKTPQATRFSLDGQEDDDDDNNEDPSTRGKGEDNSVSKTARHIARVMGQRKAKGSAHLSPSMMSDVDTLGPETPATAAEDLEKRRGDQEEEEEDPDDAEVAAINAQAAAAAGGHNNSPMTFPMNDDDEDGDDLIPPVQQDLNDDDDEEEDQPAAEEPATMDFPQPDAPEDDGDDDNMDHDEGPGFQMAETPASSKKEKKRGRKKKHRRQSTESQEDDEVTPAPQKKKRSKKQVTFSPKGYPAGNREYEGVPLSQLVEPSPDDPSVRRSKRARVKPLEYWRNERIEYGPMELDELSSDEEEDPQRALLKMDMPEPKMVIRAKDTPYRKRKVPENQGNKKKSAALKKKAGSSSSRHEPPEAATPFDSRALRKKIDLEDTDEALLYDVEEEDYSNKVVLQRAEDAREECRGNTLKPSASRKKSEGNVSVMASVFVDVPNDPDGRFTGYTMGTLLIPPGGIKDAESIGMNASTFTVVSAQPDSLQVAYCDPAEVKKNKYDPEKATHFLVGPGDIFHVPHMNAYRLQNHSQDQDCVVTWTVIKGPSL